MTSVITKTASARTRALVGGVWLQQEPTIPSYATRLRTDAVPSTAAFMAVEGGHIGAKQGSPPRGIPR